MQMCIAWQRAADMARQRTLTEERAREVISEIVSSVHGGNGLRSFTARQWFDHFAKIKSESQNPKTAAKYKQVAREFLDFLGPKADLNILSITSADVRAWRDTRRAVGLSATTLNDYITILSAIFNGAWRDHVITNNPCTAIEAVKDPVTPKRRQKQAFTVGQIKALLGKANRDWRGLILTAFYTGARLDNCANLRWRNIDYHGGPDKKGKITFENYSKHGDEHEVPLHEALKEHFLSLPTPKSDDEFVFPALANRRVTNLSKEFRKLMSKARIENQKVREKGKGAARDVWALGFHSFRRTNISLLANADVPEERRMALTAHATRDTHRGYTMHEFEELRKARGPAEIMTPNVPFKKGLNQITRKDHEGRALPRFKELLRREIRALHRAKNRDDGAKAVEKIVQENVEYHRERGFTPEEVENFRQLYAGYWPPHKKS